MSRHVTRAGQHGPAGYRTNSNQPLPDPSQTRNQICARSDRDDNNMLQWLYGNGDASALTSSLMCSRATACDIIKDFFICRHGEGSSLAWTNLSVDPLLLPTNVQLNTGTLWVSQAYRPGPYRDKG